MIGGVFGIVWSESPKGMQCATHGREQDIRTFLRVHRCPRSCNLIVLRRCSPVCCVCVSELFIYSVVWWGWQRGCLRSWSASKKRERDILCGASKKGFFFRHVQKNSLGLNFWDVHAQFFVLSFSLKSKFRDTTLKKNLKKKNVELLWKSAFIFFFFFLSEVSHKVSVGTHAQPTTVSKQPINIPNGKRKSWSCWMGVD